MDRDIKTDLSKFVQDHVVKRRAMFIPIACVSTFMLVGYAAVDKEKPEIVSSRIELLYGEELDKNVIEVIDNRDDRNMINVEVLSSSLNINQLGTYDVEVVATDQFSNEIIKIIQVDVVDKMGPEFEVLGSNEGYVIQVPIQGSNDFASYIKAIDNVDGDVTPFIEADKQLDTASIGFQTITLMATDSSGNASKETYEFAIADMEAPRIDLIQGKEVIFDYGSTFSLDMVATISDNVDESVEVIVEGSVDTKIEETQTLKITATDKAGNSSEETVNIIVKDISAPVISLSKSKITVEVGESIDARSYLASANDIKDGDISANVQISGIDTSTAGTKTITYSVSDGAGNSTNASLSVVVNQPAIAASANGGGAVGYAISRRGMAYVSGGSGPTAFDCSGLTYWAFKQVGITIPRTSGAQASSGTYVDRGSLQPGDLVFFSATSGGSISHVGMYVGGGRMIHAGTTRTGVAYSSISIMYYVTARRY